ncbi:DUF6773 family protein [Desulfosporosinus sp.]|uniref:DUF6773 family protein n=1 Tax=Desulfosporosinus sp. TaxID=157907 RepID=UPI0025BE8FB4|nr:DUF6773 family protein [Desulfosporosinus sp.]MBC2727720.1 hypothetical protein [Desulfosporosinus sp.]
MHRSQLDEMQLQKRNMVGNQAYMLLFYLLLIDIGLYGYGFRWLQYPMNVFIIMLGCMTYYLIRLIWNNSYVGPGIKNKSVVRKIGLVIALAGIVAGITISYLGSNSLEMLFAYEDNGAMILLIVSIVLFIVLAVVGLISKWQNRSGD